VIVLAFGVWVVWTADENEDLLRRDMRMAASRNGAVAAMTSATQVHSGHDTSLALGRRCYVRKRTPLAISIVSSAISVMLLFLRSPDGGRDQLL